MMVYTCLEQVAGLIIGEKSQIQRRDKAPGRPESKNISTSMRARLEISRNLLEENTVEAPSRLIKFPGDNGAKGDDGASSIDEAREIQALTKLRKICTRPTTYFTLQYEHDACPS
jgi:hypothetical protein